MAEWTVDSLALSLFGKIRNAPSLLRFRLKQVGLCVARYGKTRKRSYSRQIAAAKAGDQVGNVGLRFSFFWPLACPFPASTEQLGVSNLACSRNTHHYQPLLDLRLRPRTASTRYWRHRNRKLKPGGLASASWSGIFGLVSRIWHCINLCRRYLASHSSSMARNQDWHTRTHEKANRGCVMMF